MLNQPFVRGLRGVRGQVVGDHDDVAGRVLLFEQGEEGLVTVAVAALRAHRDRVPVTDTQPAVDPGLLRFAPVGDLVLDAVAFTAIIDLRWRLVAKELMLAILVPRHPAVALLPRAYRTPLHLRSCARRLDEIVRFFGWLGQNGITSLAQVDTHVCESYLAFRRCLTDESGTVVGEQSPGTRRAAAQVVVDLVDYRDLFTADRIRADLRPWNGASASAVAEMPSGRTENKTQPVAGEVLQPMLAAALHLVTVLGPHAVTLHSELRHADRTFAARLTGLRQGAPTAIDDIAEVLVGYMAAGSPLPMIEEHDIDQRIAAGWSPDDPLLPVATGVLARQAGHTQLWARWLPSLRSPLRDAVALVGVEKTFGRQATQVPTADDASTLAWTLPLHRGQAEALTGAVRTAAIIVLAAVSGMRASELMALRIGCRRPVEEPIAGLRRFRIASKVVKGQPLGPGTSPAAPVGWSRSPCSTATCAPSWTCGPPAATPPEAAAASTASWTSRPPWQRPTPRPGCATGSLPARRSPARPPAAR